MSEQESEQDTRWLQRLSNYSRALAQLQRFVDHGKLNEFEQQGLIKAFEFTHELAWQVMKDYFEYQGTNGINGSRDATRQAFQHDLINDGETWMTMIKSRNLSAHTYNRETAEQVAGLVLGSYVQLLHLFEQKMKGLAGVT